MRSWTCGVVASLLVTTSARADLSSYPDRLAQRPYFLPEGVAELSVQGDISQRGASQVTVDGHVELGSAVELDASVATESFYGALLTPQLQLRIPFTPDIGMFLGVGLTTDFQGVQLNAALGVAARFHLTSMIALDIPGVAVEYAKITGQPCMDPIVAASYVAPPSEYSGSFTARCMNPNGLDVRANFDQSSSGSSNSSLSLPSTLPDSIAAVVPVGVLFSPIDLFSVEAGVQFTYDLVGQPAAGVAPALLTPVAPLIASNVDVHADFWLTTRAVDAGLRLALVDYFGSSSFGTTYLASLQVRIR